MRPIDIHLRVGNVMCDGLGAGPAVDLWMLRAVVPA